MPKIRLDLHNHSNSSYDCRTTVSEFKRVFDADRIDRIAITDHSVIGLAFELKKIFGDRIVIGEEVMTNEGEIIGLFLSKEIPKGLSPEETIEEILKQNGLVYIPHPFDTRRSGIGKSPNHIDIMKRAHIIEVFNSRCFTQTPNNLALEFASKYNILKSVGSDAHTWDEIGRSYIEIEDFQSPQELLHNMKQASFIKRKTKLKYLFSPTVNKIIKKFNH
jgi:predicted metal-dependent phosphoesterase TrpH